jgi:exopolysaccharide biosynthesis WecB/TagA/CpsF family protein
MRKADDVVIGGIRTSRLSRAEFAELIAGSTSATASEAPPKLLFDLNGQGLALSVWNDAYRQDLLAADLVHADGQPMVTASRLLTRTPIAERSATTDMFHDVAAVARHSGKSFYLLGATEEVNRECAQRMAARYPGLRIVGRRHGFFPREEEAEICREINESGADIVWVGLGKPGEQAFCVRNRDRLTAAWLITCGGCFNYTTGAYGRAPRWMQDAGFEWLYRMLTRPRHLAWRYITTSPVAAFLLLLRTREYAAPASQQTHAQ